MKRQRTGGENQSEDKSAPSRKLLREMLMCMRKHDICAPLTISLLLIFLNTLLFQQRRKLKAAFTNMFTLMINRMTMQNIRGVEHFCIFQYIVLVLQSTASFRLSRVTHINIDSSNTSQLFSAKSSHTSAVRYLPRTQHKAEQV